MTGPEWLLVAVAAVAAVATACSAPDATASGAEPSVPDTVTVPLLDGPSPGRPSAEIDVGGRTLRVLVDTGSVGLRVLANRVPAGATTPVGPAPAQSYGSGVSLSGTVARTPIRIGGRAAVALVELVTGVGCVPSRPRCPAASGQPPETFGGGLDGILGIGTNAVPQVPNPLWYLGPVGHAFAVRYSGGAGELVLGEPATGYAEQHLTRLARPTEPADGPPTWRPTVEVCIAAASVPGGRSCGPTLVDTGTTALAVIDLRGAPERVLAPSTPVTVGCGEWSAGYVAGRDGEVRLAPRGTGSPGSVVGLPALARVDVRFDLDAGTVGFRDRP